MSLPGGCPGVDTSRPSESLLSSSHDACPMTTRQHGGSSSPPVEDEPPAPAETIQPAEAQAGLDATAPDFFRDPTSLQENRVMVLRRLVRRTVIGTVRVSGQGVVCEWVVCRGRGDMNAQEIHDECAST